MDFVMKTALFVETPQICWQRGLRRFWRWPGVVHLAEIAGDIGAALAPWPAPKSIEPRSDRLFQ